MLLSWFNCITIWVLIPFALQFRFIAILRVLQFNSIDYFDFNYYWIQLWSYIALPFLEAQNPKCVHTLGLECKGADLIPSGLGLSVIFRFWPLTFLCSPLAVFLEKEYDVVYRLLYRKKKKKIYISSGGEKWVLKSLHKKIAIHTRMDFFPHPYMSNTQVFGVAE